MSFQDVFPIQYISGSQWLALAPLIIMSVASITSLVLSPFKVAGRFLSFASLLGGALLSLLLLSFASYPQELSILGGTLVIDRISQVFSLIVVASGLAAALMTLGFDKRENLQNEYYSLIGFAVVGMMILVATRDLVFLFIGLELMSLAVYVLVAMRRSSAHAAEAGLKYFLLGGAASGILLYGATLLYGSTGSLSYEAIRLAYQSQWQDSLPLLPTLGLALVGIGFLFKVGAVPFHMWIPDVYMGASTPVTGFMISAVKAAAIGALLRFSTEVLATPGLLAADGAFHSILWILVAATLLLGSLAGLKQQNLKRLFAYSTIAHTGYVLLGFMALITGQRPEAADAIVSYTVFYAVMNIGAFAVLTFLSPADDDELQMSDLAGLGRKHPFVAFALSIFLMSMAGIPPTAGFFGKYYLFISAISAGEIVLTVVAVLASVISVVYYLRPLVYMYMREEGLEPSASNTPWWGNAAVLSLAVVLTIFMGLVPSWFSSLM